MSMAACTAHLGTESDRIISRSLSSHNLVHSSERTLSNKTYLRRLHIKLKNAQRLFFGAPESQSLSLLQQETGSARYMPNRTFLRMEVYLIDGRGKLWPVQYECVRHGGQRHSRLKVGWTKLCQANKFSVGDKIQFQRSFCDENRIPVVKVERIASE
jgi:hypothetical protein